MEDTTVETPRPALRRLLPRRVVIVCAVVLFAQAVTLATLVRDVREPRPHRAPVAAVAPAIVAHALADEVNALEGRPLDVTPSDDRRAAVEDVRRGVFVAVVLVDLSGTEDTLVLSSSVDDRLTRAVTEQAVAIERSHGRTLRTQWISGSDVGVDLVRGLAVVYGAVGFLLALLLSLRFGPVARTVRMGARRLITVGVVSLGAAYLTALLLPGLNGLGAAAQVQLAGILALTAVVAAALTLALEGVTGFGGVGLSGVLYLVLATPQVLGIDRHLLPDPWPTLAGWTPPGASVTALSSVALFGGAGLRRPLLVLTVWFLAAVLGLLVSRRERRRAAASPEAGLDEPILPLSALARHGRLMRWRWRVAITVLPAAAGALALISFLPQDATAEAAPVPSMASESHCVSTGQVRSVGDLNRIARTVRGDPAFLGADIGVDAQLQDGRRLWIFGDTLQGENAMDEGYVRNSMLIMGGDCIAAVLPEDGGAVIPDRPGAASYPVGYWPMSVVAVHRPGYDQVIITCQRVRSTDEGGLFGFENLGPAVALFVVPRGETPQLVTLRDVGPDLADASRPTWGAAAAVDDGWLYLYGTANPGEPYVFGFSLRVARVRPDDVFQQGAWEYWDGAGWVADPGAARELVAAAGGTSQTLSVFHGSGADRDTWYALSKRNEFLGTDVVVWRASAPWGPFDGGTTVAPLPSDTTDGQLRYMPLAHPGLLPRRGTVVVSYSQNSTDADEVVHNPFRYRPRFLRVELP